MTFIDLLNRVMHTPTHEPTEAPPTSEALDNAHKQVDHLQKDLDRLEAAVAVAETRLRARGLRVPPPPRQESDA